MNLTLLISDNCDACDRAKLVFENVKRKYPHINAEIVYANEYIEKKISITPALLIDHNIFCFGDINEERLDKKLN